MKIEYPKQPNFTNRFDKYVNFKSNWDYSYDKLTRLNEGCIAEFGENKTFSIVTAGSYGRMEASDQSDLDYVILNNETTDIPIEDIVKRVRQIAQSLEIPLPNETGVFAKSYSKSDLIEKIGNEDDDLNKLAQRLLIIMESKPIYNEELFDNIIEEILSKYLEYVIKEPTKEATFLMNDLIRYFRSIAVNYQYNFWKNNEKWTIRNVKLRHSRILMYAGTLLLILNASKLRDNKFDYIKNHIKLTPFEKIVSVYLDNNDFNFRRLIAAYDIFLSKLNSSEIRKQLQVEYDDRYKNPHYAELKVTSDSFIAELTRFIFSKKNIWSEEVFEYLIF
ncbi:hypothetical protein [Mucilaginibacter sp. HD30]